jgi:hypothetical protein
MNITSYINQTQWNHLASKGWVTFPKRAKYEIETPTHPEAGLCDPVTLEVNDGSFYVQGVLVKTLVRINGALVDTGAGWKDAVNAVEKAIAGTWAATAAAWCADQDESFLGNNLPPQDI